MQNQGFSLNTYPGVRVSSQSQTSHLLDIDESARVIYQTFETYVYDYVNQRYRVRKRRLKTEFKNTAFLGGPGNIFKRYPCPHCMHKAVTPFRLQCHILKEHSHLRSLPPNTRNLRSINEYYVSPDEFDQLRPNLNFFDYNALRPELEKIEYPEKLPVTFHGFNNSKDLIRDFEKSNVSNDSKPSTSKLIHTSSYKHNTVKQLSDNERDSNNDFISRENKIKSIKKSFSCSQCDYITFTADLLELHKQKLHCDDLKLKTANHINNFAPAYSLRKNRNVSSTKINLSSDPSSFKNGGNLSKLTEKIDPKTDLLVTKTVQSLNSKLKKDADLSSNEDKLKNVISRNIQKVESHNDELEEFENGSVIKVESIIENDKNGFASNNHVVRNQNNRKCKRKPITTQLTRSSDDNIVKKSGSKPSPEVGNSVRSQNRSNTLATLNKSNDITSKLSQLTENNDLKNNLFRTKTVQPLNSKLKNDYNVSSNKDKLENVITRNNQNVESHKDQLEAFENGIPIKVASITENYKTANINPMNIENRINKNDCASNNKDLKNMKNRKCKRQTITTDLSGSSVENVKKSGSKSAPGVGNTVRSQNRTNTSAVLNKSNDIVSKLSQLTENNDSQNNLLITKTIQPLKNDASLSSNEAKKENVISVNIQNSKSHDDQLEAFKNESLIKLESITENEKTINIKPINTGSIINKNNCASYCFNNKDLKNMKNRKCKRQTITTDLPGSSVENIVKKSGSKPSPVVGDSVRSQNRSNMLAILNKSNDITSKLSQLIKNNDSKNNLLITKAVQPLNSKLKNDYNLCSNEDKLENVESRNMQNIESCNNQFEAFENESVIKVESINENDKTACINPKSTRNRIKKNDCSSNNQDIRIQKNRKCKRQTITIDLTGNNDDNIVKKSGSKPVNKSDGISSRSRPQKRCQIKTKSKEVNLQSNKNKAFPCMDCNFVGKSKCALNWHTKRKHGKMGNVCSECDFSSTRLRELQRHQVREHNYQRPYECDICKFRAITQCDLKSHMIVCHPEKLTIEKGNIKVVSSNTKQSSVSKHKAITRKAKIMPSKSKDHESNPSLVLKDPQKINDIFQCKDCDHIAKTARSLNYHAKMIHGKFTFSCSDCNFIGNKLAVLQRHQVNVHNYPRPYACDYCEYRCTVNYQLKPHIFRAHPEVLKKRNFKIESSNLLKQPSVSKHEIEPHSAEIMPSKSGKMGFRCSVCNYSASKITLLNKHKCPVRNYPPPFGCHHCTYKSVSKRHLKTHIVLQHFKDNEKNKLLFSQRALA